MKSLTFHEFSRLILDCQQRLVSAQLQEVFHFESGVVLSFYSRKSFWLVVDLSTRPCILIYTQKPPLVKSLKAKPLTLFMNSHFKNLYLKQIEYQSEWGRRSIFIFSEESAKSQKIEFEIILIPNHANLIARAIGKQVSWRKPEEINLEVGESSKALDEFRSPEVIKEEWEKQLGTKNSAVKDQKLIWEQKKQKDIVKKQNAIRKIWESLTTTDEEILYKIGEFLKFNSLDQLPDEWRSWVNLKKDRDWNREAIFQKAKAFQKKKDGAQQRVEQIQKEIEELQVAEYVTSNKNEKHNISKFKNTSMSLRKLNVNHQAVAYMGKSAQDNMALLKQSQAWDVWFHLKDYPSSFVIVRRNRTYNLSHDDLMKTVDWFIKETISKKKDLSLFDFNIVYTECRYVKPIKGDKLGRVNYTHEQNLKYRINTNSKS
ncbi:MAG: hypothetical protein KDD45_08370 [Bdellovibrionales bacterium]|nr:hypothetical protein [Bdellovibrionales bacterium]